MGFLDQLKKSCVFLLVVVMSYVFFMSGFIACFFMLLAYIFIWPVNRTAYRKAVNNLAYLHWSQFTFWAQWWSGSNCTVHLEDPDILKYVGREHTVVTMNHKYDIDWLMAWILAERRSMLGGTKIYGKQSLRFVPLIGWAWMFTESIFLKREWEKDRRIISKDLQYVKEYPVNYPITLLLFCEGTRFTEEKHKISLEIAKKKGLPVMKHHLLPRTKGFVLSMQGVKGSVPSILDLTIGFRSDGAEPTLMSIVMGKPCKAEIYARRVPLENVPTETDEECAQWLYNFYEEKDDIYDHFVNNGCYKIGTKFEIRKRYTDLVVCIVWSIVVWVPTLYYFGGVVLNGSTTLKVGLLLFLVIASLGARLMIAVSETDKGSLYGKKTI